MEDGGIDFGFMEIGGIDFGKVAILVLDYDKQKEKAPASSMILAYKQLNNEMIRIHGLSSRLDVTVLANEKLVAKHQKDFEKIGLKFFPNWRGPNSQYRKLLREGLRQGDKIYLATGGCGNFKKVTTEDLVITDLEGKLDIKPKHPLYS